METKTIVILSVGIGGVVSCLHSERQVIDVVAVQIIAHSVTGEG